MTHTKPIDPTDALALRQVYHDGWWTQPMNGDDSIEAGVLAVARAVLPEGYVAVPVAELERWCKTLRGALDKTDPHPLGGRKVMPGGAAIDVLEVWTLINSLLPTESEATR